MTKPVFLLGLMGSGKSFLGKKLAEKLSVPFIDLDEWIEKGKGISIVEIFEKHGEKRFRDLETEYLKKIPANQKAIVALGGGTPCFNDNMQLLNELGETVYLQTDIDVIVQRLAGKTSDRPLIKNKSEKELKEFFEKQLKEREVFYRQAKHILKTETNAVEKLKRLILYPTT